MKASDQERQARSRALRASNGGKQIAIMLTPEASRKLEGLTANGESITAVINRLLMRTRPAKPVISDKR